MIFCGYMGYRLVFWLMVCEGDYHGGVFKNVTISLRELDDDCRLINWFTKADTHDGEHAERLFKFCYTGILIIHIVFVDATRPLIGQSYQQPYLPESSTGVHSHRELFASSSTEMQPTVEVLAPRAGPQRQGQQRRKVLELPFAWLRCLLPPPM